MKTLVVKSGLDQPSDAGMSDMVALSEMSSDVGIFTLYLRRGQNVTVCPI